MENKNNKSSILNLLVVLLLIGAGLLFTKPAYDEYANLNLGLQEKQNQKSSLDNELAQLRDLKSKLDAGTEVGAAKVLAAIPERLAQDQLINQITSIAQKNDVVLNSISFSIPNSAANDNIKKATITASLTGGYGDLISFLKGIEGNERKLIVKNITVQFGQTEGVARANFNVSMETYYQTRI